MSPYPRGERICAVAGLESDNSEISASGLASMALTAAKLAIIVIFCMAMKERNF
jgi:hypothetical protein